jgi:hypothetical protein
VRPPRVTTSAIKPIDRAVLIPSLSFPLVAGRKSTVNHDRNWRPLTLVDFSRAAGGKPTVAHYWPVEVNPGYSDDT